MSEIGAKRKYWGSQPKKFAKRARTEVPAGGDSSEGRSTRPTSQSQSQSQSPLRSGLDAVSPFWRMPYGKQIGKKRQGVIKVLRRIQRELIEQYDQFNVLTLQQEVASGVAEPKRTPVQLCPTIYSVSKGAKENPLICPFGGVIPSPNVEGYRNKNEFSAGIGVDGAPTIGFMLGRFENGEVRVGEPTGCRTAPLVALEIAQLVKQFVVEQGLPVWDKTKNHGLVRLVCVRNSSVLGQAMVTLQVDPTSLEGGREGPAFTALCDSFRDFMVKHCFAGFDYRPPPFVPSPPPPPRTIDTKHREVANTVERGFTERGEEVIGSVVDKAAIDAAATADPEAAAKWKETAIKRANTAWDVAVAAGVCGSNFSQAIAAASPAPLPSPSQAALAFADRVGHSVISVQLQCHSGISNVADEKSEILPLFGQSHIHDVVDDLVFRINANSFFQVNTLAAEALYSKAIQWATAPPHDFSLSAAASMWRYTQPPRWLQYGWNSLDEGNDVGASGDNEGHAEGDNEGEGKREAVGNSEDTNGDMNDGQVETKDQSSSSLPADNAEQRRNAEFVERMKQAQKLKQAFNEAMKGVQVLPDYKRDEGKRVGDDGASGMNSSDVRRKTVLLDVCCGTGTIGLIMSNAVDQVVGLELIQAAIEDAKHNMKLNNITNAEYVCGKAETTIKQVISKYGGIVQHPPLNAPRHQIKTNSTSSSSSSSSSSTSFTSSSSSSLPPHLVCIVDPPRSGLHGDVLRALRQSSLRRIIYVSCNPDTLADNVLKLSGPSSKSYPGVPFVPVAAVAMDMFPHTAHCEMIMMLERPDDTAGLPSTVTSPPPPGYYYQPERETNGNWTANYYTRFPPLARLAEVQGKTEGASDSTEGSTTEAKVDESRKADPSAHPIPSNVITKLLDFHRPVWYTCVKDTHDLAYYKYLKGEKKAGLQGGGKGGKGQKGGNLEKTDDLEKRNDCNDLKSGENEDVLPTETSSDKKQ